jgi:hypothetical protein
VPSIGFHCGGPPSYSTVVGLMSRCTVAVCGIWLAICASRACAVPGTDSSKSAIGWPAGIFAKSAGSDLPGTKLHGPPSDLELNQRPEIST